MTAKTKRTYNLSSDAVAHVRDLAARGDLATSQDGVVELAIDHLYREIRDRDDAAMWSRAAQDQAFRTEMRTIESQVGGPDDWPSE